MRRFYFGLLSCATLAACVTVQTARDSAAIEESVAAMMSINGYAVGPPAPAEEHLHLMSIQESNASPKACEHLCWFSNHPKLTAAIGAAVLAEALIIASHTRRDNCHPTLVEKPDPSSHTEFPEQVCP